jgi:lysophospholipase L1-like esterase
MTRSTRRAAGILVALAATALFLGFCSPASAFDDVAPGSAYAVPIDQLAAWGVVEGVDAQHFAPDQAVTRQQFAKMVVLTAGVPVSEADVCPFPDVEVSGPGSLYPDNYVAVAAAKGFTRGIDSGHFAPSADVTRAQVVTMAMRTLDAVYPTLGTAPPIGFGTLGSFSPDHAANMNRAEYDLLLVGLTGFGPRWDPWQPATRGEVAAVLWRLRSLGTRGGTTYAPADIVADYAIDGRLDLAYLRGELQAFLDDPDQQLAAPPHLLRVVRDQLIDHPWIRRLVFDGDSLTAGSGATLSYPTQMMASWPRNIQWKNVAIGGQTVRDILHYGAERVDSFYRSGGGRNVDIAWAGTNDIALWDHSADVIYAELRQYALDRRRQGFSVVVMTTIARSDSFAGPNFEPRRQELNRLIRANWESFADMLIDIAADPRLGPAGAEYNTTYFTPDRVHLNNHGYGLVAAIVKTRLLELDAWTAALR